MKIFHFLLYPIILRSKGPVPRFYPQFLTILPLLPNSNILKILQLLFKPLEFKMWISGLPKKLSLIHTCKIMKVIEDKSLREILRLWFLSVRTLVVQNAWHTTKLRCAEYALCVLTTMCSKMRFVLINVETM